jgi:uncharacterized protein YkwD
MTLVADPLIPPVYQEEPHGFRSMPPTKQMLKAGALDFSTTPDPTWGSLSPSYEAEVLDLCNEHRRSIGVGLLEMGVALADCAAWKALHMAHYQYMSHDDPAPPIDRSTGQRFTDFRIIGTWGENIAYGYANPRAVVNGWLASPGHKANIERANFKYLGNGAAKGNGPWYWAQCFSSMDTPSLPPDPKPDPTHKLRFDDRHAIGIYWDADIFTGAKIVQLYVWAGSNWSKVRDVPNNGNTYVTYPLAFTGSGKVKVTDSIVSVEGSFTVRAFS